MATTQSAPTDAFLITSKNKLYALGNCKDNVWQNSYLPSVDAEDREDSVPYRQLTLYQTIQGQPYHLTLRESFIESEGILFAVSVSKESEPAGNRTEVEAEFELNGEEMSANFMQDGTWLETESEMKKTCRKRVKSTLKSQFADYEIEESERIATPEQAEAYEVELEKGETTLEVMLNNSGKVLKQETTEGEGKYGE